MAGKALKVSRTHVGDQDFKKLKDEFFKRLKDEDFEKLNSLRIRSVFKAICMVTTGGKMGLFGAVLIMLSTKNLFIFDMDKMDALINDI